MNRDGLEPLQSSARAETLWITALSATRLWAMDRPPAVAFSRDSPKPLPLIGVSAVLVQGAPHACARLHPRRPLPSVRRPGGRRACPVTGVFFAASVGGGFANGIASDADGSSIIGVRCERTVAVGSGRSEAAGVGFFRGAGCRRTRGLRGQNADAVGIRPVHSRVDSRGLLAACARVSGLSGICDTPPRQRLAPLA